MWGPRDIRRTTRGVLLRRMGPLQRSLQSRRFRRVPNGVNVPKGSGVEVFWSVYPPGHSSSRRGHGDRDGSVRLRAVRRSSSLKEVPVFHPTSPSVPSTPLST